MLLKMARLLTDHFNVSTPLWGSTLKSFFSKKFFFVIKTFFFGFVEGFLRSGNRNKFVWNRKHSKTFIFGVETRIESISWERNKNWWMICLESKKIKNWDSPLDRFQKILKKEKKLNRDFFFLLLNENGVSRKRVFASIFDQKVSINKFWSFLGSGSDAGASVNGSRASGFEAR